MIARVLTLVAVLALLTAPSARASDYAVGGYQAGGHHGAPLAACPPESPYQIVAPVPVELLIGPGVDYQPLALVPACTRLNIILCAYRTGWCKVRYGRYDGWVYDPRKRDIFHYWLGH